MYFYKKIAILMIILIASYILYRLYNRRLTIIQDIANAQKENVVMEGIGPKTDHTVENLEKANTTQLTVANLDISRIDLNHGYNNPSLALQLSQYCVKASYKTAYNGADASIEMIRYVLSRGCRFIDLDLFYDYPSTSLSPNSVSQCAVVSYGTNPDSKTPVIASSIYTKLTFSSVCLYLTQHAFSTVPNSNDPLFVQLNLNCPENSQKKNFYQSVAECIAENFLTDQLFQGKVDSKTTIDLLMKKVVFVINNELCSDYQNMRYVTGVNYALMNFINMNNRGDSTTPTMLTIDYGTMQTNGPSIMQLNQNDGNSGNDVINPNFNQVLPVSNNKVLLNNMAALSTAFNTVNVMPMLFWKNDPELVKYEIMFSSQGTAIVPMYKMYSYLTWYKKQYASF